MRRQEHIPLTHLLTHLSSLWIDLGRTEVSDLACLAGAPHLHYVWCRHSCTVDDLTPLLDHPELSTLYLYGPGVSADLRALAALNRLKYLQLGIAGTNSIGFITRLPTLRHLGLDKLEQVTDLTPLATMAEIDSLSLSGYPANVADTIQQISRLIHLTLSDGPLASGVADLHRLLPQLQWLQLINVPVGEPSPLADARQLELITLHATGITDLHPISHLPKLDRIRLSDSESRPDPSPLIALPRRVTIYLNRGQDVLGLDTVRRRHRVRCD